MSKKISLSLLSLTGVCLLLAGNLASQYTTAQQIAPAVTPDKSRSAAVAAAMEEVLKETSELRQLPVLHPVKSGTQSRAEIESMVIKALDEESTPEEMRASEMVLKKFGLVPIDFEYRPFIISLLTEQVAGYYDPKAQQFHLADWIALEGQMPVMAHELTHALQDQHFNLRRFQKWPKGDGDAELAAHALVEGDATLVMMQYIMHKPERMSEFMKSMGGAAAASNEKIEGAPRVLRETLLFPYDQGIQFVTKVYANGGWKMVSSAFTDLPQSTEQILHAEKYFAREAPVRIEIADISRILGKGWKRLDYDVNGEWGYYLILDEYIKSNSESARAATGWGGDRYALYEGPKGQVMMVQLTAWDSEQDANEFYSAYVTRTEKRYQPLSRNESVTTLAVPLRQTNMETNDGRIVINQNGSRILILEGVPNKVDMGLLINSILRYKWRRP